MRAYRMEKNKHIAQNIIITQFTISNMTNLHNKIMIIIIKHLWCDEYRD